MDYNKIIIILVVAFIIVLASGIFFIFNNNVPADNVNNTTGNNTSSSNVSSNITVEKVNTEEVSGKSSSNTHLIMGEDGYYFICDDNGNILENLGPSKKHYPNNPSAVDYPDAEPASRYINKR